MGATEASTVRRRGTAICAKHHLKRDGLRPRNRMDAPSDRVGHLADGIIGRPEVGGLADSDGGLRSADMVVIASEN